MQITKTLIRSAMAAAVCLGTTALVTDVAHADTLDASGAVLRFGYDGQVINDALTLGEAVVEGSSIHYVAIATINGTTIDGVVTFVDGVNLSDDELGRIDDTLPDDEEDPYVESDVVADSAPGGSAILQIDFYLSGTYTGVGTGTLVTLNNLSVNFYDIDSLQSVTVSGISGYSLATNTIITATQLAPGAYTFASADESTDKDDGTSYTKGRVRVVYASVSSISYSLFAPEDGGFDTDISSGMPWTDLVGGGEDTSNLPPLPETGSSSLVIAALAAALLTAGVALTRVRRTAA